MQIRNVVSSCSYLRLKIRKRMLEDRKSSVMFVSTFEDKETCLKTGNVVSSCSYLCLKIRKHVLEDRKRSVIMFVSTFEDKETYV